MSPHVHVEGTAYRLRSERSGHVFSYGMNMDSEKETAPGSVLSRSDTAGWLWWALRQMPEGARVRITVEAVDS